VFKLLVTFAATLLSVAFSTPRAWAADTLIQAIRQNDLAGIQQQIKAGADVNAKGDRDTTPLMYAAAYGSVEAMRSLIAAGADVKARNAFEATALLWCTYDLNKVRLLVEHGADVNAASKQARTPVMVAAAYDGSEETVKYLLANRADPKAKDFRGDTALHLAAFANDLAVVKLLIDKGLDVNAPGEGGLTPLMIAASLGNLDAVKLLLSKGANVNAVCSKHMHGTVKNGPIALGDFTPLLLAVAYGSPALVKTLLDAGANVNARDVRGMTPLMHAVTSECQKPEVVRMLLAKGADTSLKSNDGETAYDWASKFGNASTMGLLGPETSAGKTTPPAAAVAVSDVKITQGGLLKSAEKGLGLMQKTTTSFFKNSGCVGCHHQNMTAIAAGLAMDRGLKIDKAAADDQLKTVKSQWTFFQDLLLQRVDPPGGTDTLSYSILGLAATKYPPDAMTNALAITIAGQQNRDGSWHQFSAARAPMQDSDISRTALGLRSLQLYGPEGRKAEMEQRIRRAGQWLLHSTATYNEESNMQLLGLKWSGADAQAIERLAKALIAQQRPDGGWSQNANLSSDAYATSESLYALNQAAGIPTTSPVYQRGLSYLLRTQLEDGSWHVKSRAVKLQPYFQSGFPHNHDQWISATSTAWATAAILLAVERPVSVASAGGR
jgi:ankyrin repeat protein